MVFGLGSFEQMELDEPRNAIEIQVTTHPHFLESPFGPSPHTERFMAINIVFSPDYKGRSSLATLLEV